MQPLTHSVYQIGIRCAPTAIQKQKEQIAAQPKG